MQRSLAATSEYPINGFGVGLPEGFTVDSAWSAEERVKKSNEALSFIIFTAEPIPEDQKKKILNEISEKFFKFVHVGAITALSE